MTEDPHKPVLPNGVDNEEYARIRSLMRLSVLRVWRSDHVIAGIDPWVVVDEAWGSMARNGFQSEGPFEPFALRVARNKAFDALGRSEVRKVIRSLDEPIPAHTTDAEPRVHGDLIADSGGADDDYFTRQEHLAVIQRLAFAEAAIFEVLAPDEREVFISVRIRGKSRAAVGRELDPPVTGQRVGQIVAAATIKIKTFVDKHEERSRRYE